MGNRKAKTRKANSRAGLGLLLGGERVRHFDFQHVPETPSKEPRLLGFLANSVPENSIDFRGNLAYKRGLKRGLGKMGQHTLNRLKATKVANLVEKGYYADGGGLHFRVSGTGSRSWAFIFTRAGKTREMGLGAYPAVSLKEARERAAEASRLLRDEIDPIDQKRVAKSAAIVAHGTALTFEQCAEAFIAVKEHEWKNPKSGSQWRATLKAYAYTP